LSVNIFVEFFINISILFARWQRLTAMQTACAWKLDRLYENEAATYRYCFSHWLYAGPPCTMSQFCLFAGQWNQ